jgi:hypothetical protein
MRRSVKFSSDDIFDKGLHSELAMTEVATERKVYGVLQNQIILRHLSDAGQFQLHLRAHRDEFS